MRWLTLAVLILAACNDNLPIASFIDKLRVLAIQASPAEVAPGTTARLSPLVVEPRRRSSSLSALWLACRTDATAPSTLPCGIDELDGTSLPPDCGVEATGSTCTLDEDLFTVVIPSASLAGSDGTGQLLVTLVVSDAGSASDCYLDTLKNKGLPTEPDHCVVSYKRLTVATSPTNHNPEIDELLFVEKDGEAQSLLSGTATAEVSTSDGHRTTDLLGVVRAADAAEIEVDGSYENLALSWFTDAGAIDGGRSDFTPQTCGSQESCSKAQPLPSVTTKWNAPTASELTHDGITHLWAVLRDDRGGVSWRTGQLTVER